MGLVFSVGNPTDAFESPFAEQVRDLLTAHFSTSVVVDSKLEPWYSNEISWSGWQSLQERAAEVVDAKRLTHLLSMKAWRGCYVPANTEPWSIDIETEGWSEPLALAVASLSALVAELEAVGLALDLSIDDAGLRDLAAKYQDDELIDADMEIQTYAQLLLGAHEAQRRRQPLWVVK